MQERDVVLEYCIRVYSGDTCIAVGLASDYSLPFYIEQETKKTEFINRKHRIEVSYSEKQIVVKY